MNILSDAIHIYQMNNIVHPNINNEIEKSKFKNLKESSIHNSENILAISISKVSKNDKNDYISYFFFVNK